jgi:hypothetical protein
MAAFIPGLELCRLFYEEAVRPILDAVVPGLPHSAALLGRGSEVLGFDDEMSVDHYWGPRVQLFLRDEEHDRHSEAIYAALSDRLPHRFRDYWTDLTPRDPEADSARPPEAGDAGPVKHHVDVLTLRSFFLEHLAFDIDGEIGPADWLTFSEQQLCMMTAGAVYHDEIGLQAVRDRIAYYPQDVWLYLLAAGWWRIHPEGNLAGRAGFVGDELGSAVIGSRLVCDLMRLCFLMERRYAPYSKWFGTAFARLACAAELLPILSKALRAETWPEREATLATAYEHLAAMHNALQITEPVSVKASQLWGRPFKVLWGDFPGALMAQIQDPAVKRLAEQWPFGGVDQVREILWGPRSRRLLLRLFEAA